MVKKSFYIAVIILAALACRDSQKSTPPTKIKYIIYEIYSSSLPVLPKDSIIHMTNALKKKILREK